MNLHDNKKLCSKDWMRISPEYLSTIKDKKVVVEAHPGDLVLWDSRTFHQNQYGHKQEERIVQYVCYLPKAHRSFKEKKKRMQYFQDRRTTSHWPYPVKVNSKQPQTYGNNNLLIPYEELRKPDLGPLMPKIMELI